MVATLEKGVHGASCESHRTGQHHKKCGIIEAMSSLYIRSVGEAPASLWTLDASQVRDLTASLSPTPGGGSISVFTATLGMALVHKGASVSLKRVGDDVDRREAIEPLCVAITSTLNTLSDLADDDSRAFQDYIKARALPRSTGDERVLREAAMEAAVVGAIRVPLASARSICEALAYAESVLLLADQHLLTDVFGGAILMQAAFKAVLLNVDANAGLLADVETRRVLEGERADLERLSFERNESIARAYQARMTDSKDFAGVTD